MSSSSKRIIDSYTNGTEDTRVEINRSSSLEFFYTKKHLEGYIKSTDKVLEIGCATGHYAFYYADKCNIYHGVDIVPKHIQIFEEKIKQSEHKNLSCGVGDATSLSSIKDNSFDVVLCLGPMYHLPPSERELTFAECKRVCKPDGILAFAYINKIGVYVGGCIIDKSHYPNKNANERVLENGVDDIRPDMFYFSTPEEMNLIAKKQGLTYIKNLGTDFFVTYDIVNNMSDEQFEVMRPLYDQMVSHESCTGMSNHALLICRKWSLAVVGWAAHYV